MRQRDLTPSPDHADVVLVGAGIMSATLAVMLRLLEPAWSVAIVERLGDVGRESSDSWNNSGTGHAALCEFNYTPQRADGSVDVANAIEINEQFQLSLQFWAYLVSAGIVDAPETFIRTVPHMSFALGSDGVAYLNQRYRALKQLPLFGDVRASDDPAVLRSWLPLMFDGRDDSVVAAVSRSDRGTEVDYGNLTRQCVAHLRSGGVSVLTGRQVVALRKDRTGRWSVRHSGDGGDERHVVADRFLFVGAGGGSLALLQGADIPAVREICGFPISGLFYRTDRSELVARHAAKVYGQAGPGAPSISIPHLDRRTVNGAGYLTFGPFAAFSTRFLKSGGSWDFPRSLTSHNVPVLASAIRDNVGLVGYTVGQIMARDRTRFAGLRRFVPTAERRDWELVRAGQRVQVIRRARGRGEIVGFGTELVVDDDRRLAALLGASPGASSAPAVMLDLLRRCFPQEWQQWQPRIHELVPSLGHRLLDEPALLRDVLSNSSKALHLDPPRIQ